MIERGFTLLELLVTLTIIAALSAIAIPQYNHYRKKVFDLRAQSDLRNGALAEESYFLDNEKYLSCDGEACLVMDGLSRISNGVKLKLTASETGFRGEASHPKGSGKVYHWDSEKGGIQQD